MTLAEMLTDLTSRIGVVNGQEISNTMLTFWLNEAMRVFCEEDDFNWLMKRVQSSAVASQSEYVLPTDMARPFELRVNSTTSSPNVYEYVPYEQRYGIQTGQNAFTYIANTLILYPTPTANGSLNIDLTYVSRPTNMAVQGDSPADSDIANMPETFHPALVTYAFALYNGYDEEATDSQYWLGNATNPAPGTYYWFVKLAQRSNQRLKKGARRKMLSRQEAIGYTRSNQVGKVSPVLQI